MLLAWSIALFSLLILKVRKDKRNRLRGFSLALYLIL